MITKVSRYTVHHLQHNTLKKYYTCVHVHKRIGLVHTFTLCIQTENSEVYVCEALTITCTQC